MRPLQLGSQIVRSFSPHPLSPLFGAFFRQPTAGILVLLPVAPMAWMTYGSGQNSRLCNDFFPLSADNMLNACIYLPCVRLMQGVPRPGPR